MSTDGLPPPVWPQQGVLRVHHGVLIDTPLVPTWGSAAWAAVVWRDDRAAGGWARAVMAPGPGGRGYAADGLTPGDVIEFGADYRHQTGRKSFEMVARRWYGVVLATHPEHLVTLGPFPAPEPARQWAERAMAVWRQSLRVDIPGITDAAADTAPLAIPVVTTPAAPLTAEIRTEGRTTSVDDPTHGRLVVDTALFDAAMSVDGAELANGLRHFHVDHGHPRLTGAESKETLAALTVRYLPNYVRDVLLVDAEIIDAEVVDAEVVTAPIPVVGAGGKEPVYYGHPDGRVERVDDTGSRPLRPPRRWTPDGFSWGYRGDGPTELAYALLADATGSADVAGRWAGRYAAEVVAHLPQGEAWSRPVAAVGSWAAEAEQRPAVPTARRSTPTKERDVGTGL